MQGIGRCLMAAAQFSATARMIPRPITEAATLEVPRRVAEILAAVEMVEAEGVAAETKVVPQSR